MSAPNPLAAHPDNLAPVFEDTIRINIVATAASSALLMITNRTLCVRFIGPFSSPQLHSELWTGERPKARAIVNSSSEIGPG